MSQLRKNISYNFLLTLAQLLFPVFSIPYISRVLSPEGLGKVNFTDSLSYYFVTLADLGIASFGIREIARIKNHKNELNKLASDLLSFSIIGGCIFLLIYWLILFFVYDKISDIRLVVFSSVFLIANSLKCEWFFLGTEKFKYIALRSFFIRFVGLICIFLFIKRPEDFYLYYIIMVCSALFISFWNLSIFFNKINFRFSISNWKHLFAKTRIMYCINLLSCISLMLDNVLLGLVATSAIVAFYTLGTKVVRIACTLISDSFYVLYPNTVFTLHNKENKEYIQLLNNSFQWITIIALPLCFGIFLFADDFTRIYFGTAFGSVSNVIRILSIYPLLHTLWLFLNLQILIPHNNEFLILKSLFVSVLVFVPANLILSYHFSFWGTCVALLISELILVVFTYHLVMKKRLPVQFLNVKSISQVIIGMLFFIPIYYCLKIVISNPLFFC